MRNILDKSSQKIKTQILYSKKLFPRIVPFMEYCGKTRYSRSGHRWRYTGCLQKNGAVSKINKKFISHLTRPKRTPSAAATVQVSHALPAVRFSCLMRGRTMHGASFLNRARNSCCTVIKDLDTSKRSTQKTFSCCDAILETVPAAPH